MALSLLQVGDKAPPFRLPDQGGTVHALNETRGLWTLVYFYPRDNTPGCTAEACAVRDNFTELKKAGVTVFGISTDSIQSHKKFAEKHKLPFTLLADETKKTVRDYGVWGEKKFLGKTFHGTRRTSFLIDPIGQIVKIYEKVHPAGHANEVLRDVKTFTR